MRIPTSAIVMSLLTAVPLGLGIRDTLKRESAPTAKADPEWDAYEAELEAELSREEQRRQQRRTEQLAKLDRVYGSAKASLGPLMAGVRLGVPMSEEVEEMLDTVRRRGSFDIHVRQDGAAESLTALAVTIDLSDVGVYEPCDLLRDKLVDAWGPAVNGAWLNPETRQRASLGDRGSCTLTFSQFVDPADWIAMLPLDTVGTPVEKLAQKDERFRDIDPEDSIVRYSIPGVGYGTGATVIHVDVHRGRVVGATVDADTDYDTLVAIREALNQKLGPSLGSSLVWKWRKKPGFTLTPASDGKHFTLDIGTL